MNASVALAPSKLVFMGGMAENSGPPAERLPRNLNDIMFRLAYDWNDNGDAFKAISDAVYAFRKANGEAHLTAVVAYAKRRDVSLNIINQAIQDGRERWNSSQPKPTNESDNTTEASSKGDADKIRHYSPAPQAIDRSKQNAASNSEPLADGPRDMASKKTEITNGTQDGPALAVPGVRLMPPFNVIEEVGDPLNIWQICWSCDDELKDLDKKYLAYMRTFLNNDSGDAFPGLKRIVEDLRIAKKTIGPMRERIQARGYLDVEPGSAGRFTPTRCFPRIPDFADSSVMVSHRKLLSKPSMVSHAETIRKLLMVSKTGLMVSKTPSMVSARGNLNIEHLTKDARKARRAKKGAPACALQGANGKAETDARVEAVRRITQAIAEAAHCSVERVQQTLGSKLIDLCRAWEDDPDAARHTKAFQALQTATH